MAHTHPVIDGDNHFIIDAITRAVTNAESKKTILMQNDHNSEQFTFEINKLVEGHDMTLCNKVEVHYINEDSNKKNKNVGVYEVTDMRESEEDSDRLIFSWLVSENATLYAGSLRFLIVFSCIEKGDVTYRWNTNVNASISIAKGMNNGEAIEEAYPDVLTQWKSELFAALYGMETTYVGPHEPETYPYIWFDTSEYLDQTDPYVGVIKVKDANGNVWPIYPFTKLAATDGGDLQTRFDELVRIISELERTMLTTSKVANNLTTEEEGMILDARQGKVLDDKIEDVAENAAPAGYGLGASSKEIDDWNAAIANGFYRSSASCINGPVEGSQYHGIMINYSSVLGNQIAFKTWVAGAEIWTRRYYNGDFEPWECDNPPMTPGVEYRTTDRIDGKAVYKKNVDGVIHYRLDGETDWKPCAKAVGAAVTFTVNSFLVHNGWSSTAPYTQTVNVNGILASDTPLAYPYKPDNWTDDNMRACLESWDCVDQIVAGDGTITAYGYDEKPPDNIAFMIKIVR